MRPIADNVGPQRLYITSQRLRTGSVDPFFSWRRIASCRRKAISWSAFFWNSEMYGHASLLG